MFKWKDRHKVELEEPETMKLFGSIKKSIGKTGYGENMPSFEVVEVVQVWLNLIDNHYQQKSEVLCTFTLNKYCPYF